MKALILVGGYGTRLRPLTFSVPKPLVPFANLPISLHQIQALIRVGVKKIILAVNVQPQALLDFCQRTAAEYGVSIVCSQEDVPMGTAGPIYLARQHLLDDDEPFFMFNSDVICDFPLQAMLDFHRGHGGEGTIMVTQVKDPSKYGVVVADDKGQIQRFVEKPQDWVGDKINAGIYLFNTAVVKRVDNKPTSIEREIFPRIADEHKLYSMVLQGYWMDIGQPKDFLAGQVLHLAYTQKHAPATLASGPHILGNVIIHPTATIGNGALIGPDVVIGPAVHIGEGARIKRTCLLEGAKVGPSAYINGSIIGWQSTIGSHAHVNSVVLGEDVQIANEISVNEIVVCPHKGVGSSEYTGKIIM